MVYQAVLPLYFQWRTR